MSPAWLPWLVHVQSTNTCNAWSWGNKIPHFCESPAKGTQGRQTSALPWATQGRERMLLNCTDFESKANTLFKNVKHVACLEYLLGPGRVGSWWFSRTTQFFDYHPGIFQSPAQVKGETPKRHLAGFLISFSRIIHCLEQRS